jgi:hypothetical protein
VAYFAEIDETGTVLQVIAVSNADAPDPAPSNSEPLGQAFIASLGLEGTWKQTSYNNSWRKMYAPIGGRYLADADVFIAPQPFPSWSLDANHDWQPPTQMPEEGGPYTWDEDTLAWVGVSA